ncbi:hypothetical protein AAFF_G00069000 [Aldrovandia affinis]|uniref:Uncharacterized protein n=1 Tax=Aldrovandia affinis TaxID=143900 RepID=A0AAD7WDC8_9TELE|nr:hypothetical protein AAFF_G00069000 [Aldrovandia affinis]
MCPERNSPAVGSGQPVGPLPGFRALFPWPRELQTGIWPPPMPRGYVNRDAATPSPGSGFANGEHPGPLNEPFPALPLLSSRKCHTHECRVKEKARAAW